MGEGGADVNPLMPPTSRQEPASPALQQLVEAMNGGTGLFGPVGIERVSPGMVIDVASLILQGFHAVPVKLKMLLDRLFSLLSPEDITAVLRGFGWTIQDYQRGYILKDPQGGNLEKWRMCSPEDEPLILQQFLRFSVTRPLTQQLILQELCEKNADSKHKLQEHMMKMMNNNKPGEPVKQTSPSLPTSTSSANSPSSAVSPVLSHPSPVSSQSRTSPESVSSHHTVPTSSLPVNGSLPPPSPVTSSSSITSPSPLNKLQSMHPFDYRKSERRTPEIPRSPVEKPLPPSMSPMRFHQPGMPPGYPIPPSFGVHPSMAPYQHQMARFHETERKPKDEHLFNPMNLSRGHEPKHSRGQVDPVLGRRPHDSSRQYDAFHEDLGTTFVNPATGKKRVQCNVCLKTFCDKGALKIHFSAVHLREMHKCSVPGCNMMFSSRRSRNRHSANPNPKLHTPHIRRKISPHDGRTHQGPVIPFGVHHPKPPISQHHMPGPHPGLPVPGVPPFHHFPNLPPHLMPPELQKLHHQQMELQRFQEMQKLSSLYSRHLVESGGLAKKDEDRYKEKDRDQHSNVGSEIKSESETDDQKADITDDDKSTDNQSTKDENSAGRKRKSQNPIRITHSENKDDEINYSSDDNDEGFPDPMDDDDEDDETLMDYDSTDEPDDQIRLAKERKLNMIKENEETTNSSDLKNDVDDKQADHQSGNEGKENISDAVGQDEKFEGATGKIQVRNDLTDHEKFSSNNNNNSPTDEAGDGETGVDAHGDEMTGSNPPSPTGSDYQGLLDAEIPIDKENPRRCVDCGKEFQNHFTVKIHYQNVHLKLMHKCTVDGCNAAFPSKRSRDRHSSNLTLHRKLLSTSSDGSEVAPTPLSSSSEVSPGTQASGTHHPSPHDNIPPPPYQNEFLARFLAEQQQRLAFPFLPNMSSSPHSGQMNTHSSINAGACKGSGMVTPPFGMLPFNPLLSDMTRLPGLFHKAPGHPEQPPPNKMMEENLRKYMAMAGLVNKIENH